MSISKVKERKELSQIHLIKLNDQSLFYLLTHRNTQNSHKAEEACKREWSRGIYGATQSHKHAHALGPMIIRHSPVNSGLFYMKVISKQPLCCSIIPKTASHTRDAPTRRNMLTLYMATDTQLHKLEEATLKKTLPAVPHLFFFSSSVLLPLSSLLPLLPIPEEAGWCLVNGSCN